MDLLFSAVNGSKVLLSRKIPIQSVGHSTRRYRGTRGTSLAHAQEGVTQARHPGQDPRSTVLYCVSLVENVIRE